MRRFAWLFLAGLCVGPAILPAMDRQDCRSYTEPQDVRLYLKPALETSIITDEVERRFLSQLTDVSLIAFLGYAGPAASSESSDPFLFVQLDRMRLQEVFTDRIDGRERTIYVFAQHTGWPGWNNTCVVLTDGTGSILDWRGRKQSDMYKSAKYANGKLEITCARRGGMALAVTEYRIGIGSIDSCGTP